MTAARTADLLRASRYSAVHELGWGDRVQAGAAEIRAFEQGLYQFMDSSGSSLVQRITNEKVLTDEIRAELGAALKEYKEKYRAEKALAK